MQTRFLYLFSFFLLATCYDYDYLLLVIENAGTVCESKTCSNPNKGTETGGVLNMHGLWPNYFNGSWPQSCGELAKVKYEDSKIEGNVLEELDANWVGLYSSTTTFRNHEWQKHGSCYESAKSFNYNSINQQMNDYFSTTMDIKKTLDLDSLIFDPSKLSADGSSVYWDYDELKEMLAKTTGVERFAFNCRAGSPYQKLYVIEICISKELEVIDCPEAFRFRYNCTEGTIAVPILQ